MRVLVTGFTAFGGFEVNPSVEVGSRVASALGAEFLPLEVAYAAVDALVARLAADPPDVWVMVGVAGKASAVRFETRARNVVGTTPDVRGVVLGPGPVGSAPEAALPSTLFRDLPPLPDDAAASDDAGDYLCNYLYFRALASLAATRCGFVHIAPATALGLARQVEIVTHILRDTLATRA